MSNIQNGQIRTIADLIRHFQEKTLNTISVKAEIRNNAAVKSSSKRRSEAKNSTFGSASRRSVKAWTTGTKESTGLEQMNGGTRNDQHGPNELTLSQKSGTKLRTTVAPTSRSGNALELNDGAPDLAADLAADLGTDRADLESEDRGDDGGSDSSGATRRR